LATSTDLAAALPDGAKFKGGHLTGAHVTFRTPGTATLTLQDSSTPLVQDGGRRWWGAGLATVVLTSPATGSQVRGAVAITATGTTAAGASIAALSILRRRHIASSGTDATLTASWDTTELPEGAAIRSAQRVADNAGKSLRERTGHRHGHSPSDIPTMGCGCGSTGVAPGWLLVDRRAGCLFPGASPMFGKSIEATRSTQRQDLTAI